MSVTGEGTANPCTASVLALLVERLHDVLGHPDRPISADTRFDEDLHADSLDLVEVVESVEQELRSRGLQVSLSDAELVSLTTVGQAAERIAGATRELHP